MKLIVTLALVCGALVACGDDDWTTLVGDSCENEGIFACGTDEEGNKSGELLFCSGGSYQLARTCGDVTGCFTEASNSVGRCFGSTSGGVVCESNGSSYTCSDFTN